MKKIKIVCLASGVLMLALITKCSVGQGLYINAGLGYGMSAVSQPLTDITSFTLSSTQNGSSSTDKRELIKGSLGAGIHFGASVGYMFNKNLGGEVGVSVLSGAESEGKSTSSSTSEFSGFTTSNSSTKTDKTSGSMLRIIPAVKIKGDDNAIMPYLKVGMVLGLSPEVELTFEGQTTSSGSNSPSTTTTSNETIKYSGGSSLGFMAALGADFKMSDLLAIYGEIGLIAQTWAPAKREITAYTVDGVDQLSKMKTIDKETEYVDEFTESSGSGTNDGVPDKALKIYMPFSSWGLNVGVNLTFGK